MKMAINLFDLNICILRLLLILLSEWKDGFESEGARKNTHNYIQVSGARIQKNLISFRLQCL